jgi:F-type H+-transporting ATPase subunit delta
MMKSATEIKREAKHLFRLCFVNGSLDEDRVRGVLQGILGSKRRGSLPLAGQFQRLVSLDRLRHTAKVESAMPLSPELQANVHASLVRTYGPELKTSFAENPALIGGMRIKVGSDVYDGSIKAGLAALENSF